MNCNAEQTAQIQAAAEKADAASHSCLPCPDNDEFRERIRSAGKPNQLVFQCVPWNVNPSTLRFVCGVKARGTELIQLTPDGLNEVPGCGCLEGKYPS